MIGAIARGYFVMGLEDFSNDQLAEIYRRAMKTRNWRANEPEDTKLNPPGEGTKEGSESQKSDEEKDAGYYRAIVRVIFHQGMNAKTVEKFYDILDHYFGDYRNVKDYDESDISRMMSDRKMFRAERKIRYAIEAAKTFADIVGEEGSFSKYVDSFDAENSYENTDRLADDIARRFYGFGMTSARHLLSYYGHEIVKPDIWMMRIFNRIGLTDRENDADGTVEAARRMAEAAGVPVYWVDRLVDLGLTGYFDNPPVCGSEPDCKRCLVQCYCRYFREHNVNSGIKAANSLFDSESLE